MATGKTTISSLAKNTLSRRDGLILGVTAMAALLAGTAWAQQPATSGAASEASLFELLPDWSQASADTPMQAVELVNLKDAAIRFLKRAESKDLPALEKEMQDFAARYCQPGNGFNLAKASGLFVLMRVIFEVPDLVGANESWNFGGWYSSEDVNALKDKREADDFHPSWPIYLARISNKLYVRSNTNAASIGPKPAYKPLEEYRFMTSKYKFRTAESLAKMEFIFIAGK